MDTIITGSAFGASLAASGMYEPYLIASQFTLQKWNMVQTFLTATGCSALTIELLRRLGHPVPPPRSWSPTGITGSPIDGNVLGGLLLGAGMSLSSSCPGMVFPQIALGIPSAPAIIAGASVGGICWSAVLRPWIAARRKQTTITNTTPPPEVSLAGFLGTRHTTALVAYGTALATIVAVVALRMPSASSPLHPVTGGLVIGAAQAVSLLLRGSLLGVSTCYEQLGDWIVWRDGGRGRDEPCEGVCWGVPDGRRVEDGWGVRVGTWDQWDGVDVHVEPCDDGVCLCGGDWRFQSDGRVRDRASVSEVDSSET